MKAIETKLRVGVDHSAVVQLPTDVQPGEHRAVILLHESLPSVPGPLVFPSHDVGPWPEGFRVSREEIYGDDGR